MHKLTPNKSPSSLRQDFCLYSTNYKNVCRTMQEPLSKRNVGCITNYVTEVAYMEVGKGREQDAVALQH